MKNAEFDRQLEKMLEVFPKEEVLEFYPRRIVTPLAYLSPIYFSLISFTFINHTEPYENSPELLKRRHARRLFLKVLTEKFVPTYFLDESFLDAVDQTDMLESFTFSQLHFPMPGFLLVLPHDWIIAKAGAHIPFVVVSTRDGFLHISQDVVGDDCSLRFVANNIRYEDVKDTISATIKLRKGLAFTTEEAPLLKAVMSDSSDSKTDNTPIYIFELIMKLLVILSTQPNALVDAPKEARKARARKDGVVKTEALWHPCFIGKSKSESLQRGGIGPAKRMHWRRGHLRNQRYGLDRSMVKAVWIKPVLIHSEMLGETLKAKDAGTMAQG